MIKDKKKKKNEFPRLTLIINHPRFVEEMDRIETLENDRIFCKHGRDHSMTVARIGRIIWNEKGKLSKNVELEHIYATALLHDIGRGAQYTEGTPHEEASIPIAKDILTDCGYTEAERAVILEAISEHRDKDSERKSNLSTIIQKADKQSRDCFFCKASSECKWSEHKKNKYVRY